MSTEPVYIYPSLGNSFSMKRYLTGVIGGLKANKIPYKVIQPKVSGLIGKYLIYPFLAFKNRHKLGWHLVISERYGYLIPFMSKRSIIVCHDLHTLYKQANTPKIHQFLYKSFIKAMKKAGKVVCVSNHTKKDLISYFSIFSESNVQVIHNGIEEFWIEDKVKGSIDEDLISFCKSHKVILSVGTDVWYKDMSTTLSILGKLGDEYALLRIGELNEHSLAMIQDLSLTGRVRQEANVSDEVLKYCYQNANCLLFPSLSEGFGWPALEALLCNCPVVTTGKGAIAEVVKDQANFFESIEEGAMMVRELKIKPEKDRLKFLSWEAQVLILLSN
ncbi:MAG: glycosyltransferase involved in cell wall biosynthesis [Parvicella sp.]